MVDLKITVNGSIADIKVYIVGEKLHPDFRMRIDLQERKIVSTDVTGIQERLSAEEVEETLGKEAQNFRRLLLCGSGSVFTGIYIPEIF